MRRFVVVSSALFVALLAGPISGAGAIPNPAGTGVTTCAGAWTGAALGFIPPLKNGGTSTSLEIEIKATIKPCTTVGGGPTPASGNLIGKGIINHVAANSCATVFAGLSGSNTFTFAATARLIEQITWAPSSISPTKVIFPTIKETSPALATQPVAFSDSPGTAGGSYPTAAATQTLKTVKTDAMILSAAAGDCGSAGGVASLVLRAPGTTGKY
jgi:hypothetical protein